MSGLMHRAIGLGLLALSVCVVPGLAQMGTTTITCTVVGTKGMAGSPSDYFVTSNGTYTYTASGGYMMTKITVEYGKVDDKGVFTALPIGGGPYDAALDPPNSKWLYTKTQPGVNKGDSIWARAKLLEYNMKEMKTRTAVEATSKYTAPSS